MSDSLVHDTADVVVKGTSIFPFPVVPTGTDIVQVSRPEVLRGESCLRSEEFKELIVISLGVAFNTPTPLLVNGTNLYWRRKKLTK